MTEGEPKHNLPKLLGCEKLPFLLIDLKCFITKTTLLEVSAGGSGRHTEETLGQNLLPASVSWLRGTQHVSHPWHTEQQHPGPGRVSTHLGPH